MLAKEVKASVVVFFFSLCVLSTFYALQALNDPR